MRLLFVAASFEPGGAERQTLTLAHRLAQRGHDCHLAHVKPGARLLERDPLPGPGTARSLDAARYLDLGALGRLARHAARLRPDAVVAVNAYALMYARLALCAARVRAALVVTWHSTRLLGAKQRAQMALYRPFFWSAQCTVFVCESQRRHWRRRAVLSRRNEVIYNGVDTSAWCDRLPGEERARLRAALGLREQDFVVGMSALLRPEKNHLQMLEALAQLRDLGLPARALFIGDGEMRGALEARALALGLRRDVVITGVQADVRPYLEACDVLALCSVTEAFSLAAIEAMALRKPVVHSEVGGAAEMILPGRTGFLFPVGDTPALVDRLARLADPGLCRRMGDRARGVVELFFSERTMVERYEKLLLELCAAPRAHVAIP